MRHIYKPIKPIFKKKKENVKMLWGWQTGRTHYHHHHHHKLDRTVVLREGRGVKMGGLEADKKDKVEWGNYRAGRDTGEGGSRGRNCSTPHKHFHFRHDHLINIGWIYLDTRLANCLSGSCLLRSFPTTLVSLNYCIPNKLIIQIYKSIRQFHYYQHSHSGVIKFTKLFTRK